MMKVIDLFSGCGGMSLGFQNAKFNILAAFDNWKPAAEVYRDNFNHPIFEDDLGDENNFEKIEQYKPDIIIGGPPCQDFSSAGKRDETLGRADLTISYSKIIEFVRPNYFVMENVDRIVKSRILKEVMGIFKESGYGLTYIVLDASYCGVPQARKRFFLIGHLGGEDNAVLPYLIHNQSHTQMTVRDYLGNKLKTQYYYRHPRNYSRRAIFSIDEPSPTIRGVNRPIPPGYEPHPGDLADISKARPLTTKERSYIQTFPETFVFNGSKTNLEQIIGNAVPVKLAEFVATCIKQYIEDLEIKKPRFPSVLIPESQIRLNLI